MRLAGCPKNECGEGARPASGLTSTLFPMRGVKAGAIALVLAFAVGACGEARGSTSAGTTTSVTSSTTAVTTTQPTGSTSSTMPIVITSTTVRPPAAPSAFVAGLDAADNPCPTPRTPGDELDEAEQFLRAVARGDNVDDRISHDEWLGPEGPTQPTTKFLERVHASLDELRGLPADLTLAGVPEMSRRCYSGYPAGCDFVGDLHTECVALLRRADGPSILVVFVHAGRGFEDVAAIRGGGGLAAARAARGLDIDELFSTDVLHDDGTRSPRTTPTAEVAEALRTDLAGATYGGERCVEAGRHIDCAVLLRREGSEFTVHFRVAPNADIGWSIESYALA